MVEETVRVDWMKDQLFLLRDHFGFPIVMTQPGGVSGADLLPLSIIGCVSWDIVAILLKQRQQLTGLEVAASSVREEEPPWRFKSIHIVYRIRGRALNSDGIQRAIQLSETKYCSTFATLRQALDLSSEFEIVDE